MLERRWVHSTAAAASHAAEARSLEAFDGPQTEGRAAGRRDKLCVAHGAEGTTAASTTKDAAASAASSASPSSPSPLFPRRPFFLVRDRERPALVHGARVCQKMTGRGWGAVWLVY
jgi:hypothetical protein